MFPPNSSFLSAVQRIFDLFKYHLEPNMRILLLAGLALTAATAQETSLPWSKMVWEADTRGGRTTAHAALMVEVQIESIATPVLMQLDTGANNDVLYTKIYEQLHPKETPGDQYWIGLTGTVAGRSFKGEWFAHAHDEIEVLKPGQTPVIGTIGAAFFKRRILVMDFASGRIAILGRDEDLPSAIADRCSFVPIDFRNDKMFIKLTLNGEEESDMFFDSGSSAMMISTTPQRWLKLTGRQPDDERNQTQIGTTWGKEVKWIGAPIRGDMCIGNACVAAPIAWFPTLALPALDFDKYPFKTTGLFGNAPFDGRYTVVVDLPHKHFGLMEGSLTK
jgi:hypothetical protein